MGIIMNRESEQSDLQKRIEQRLSDQAKKEPVKFDKEGPDYVDDSAYIKGTNTTSSHAWIWIIVIVIIAGVLLWLYATR